MAPELYHRWKDFLQEQTEKGKLHFLLEGDIPPAPRKEYQRPFFWDYVHFDDIDVAMDCLCIEGWFLRFALEEQDGREVENILSKMDNLCRYMRHTSNLGAETFRLHAIVRVAETEHADISWLDKQIAYLDNLEKGLPALEKQWIYQSAALYAIKKHDMAHHLADSQAKGADLSKLRVFFPLVWWRTAYQAQAVGKIYQCDSFSQMKLPEGQDDFYTNFRDAYLVTKRINSLLVSIRGVRTLLEAKRIRLLTGAYPQTMEDLPVDPFTNQPLQFSVGPIEMDVDVIVPHKEENQEADSSDSEPDYDCTCGCDCSEGCKCEHSGKQILAHSHRETRRVDALQVFSPGGNAEEPYDDIRFFIRLTPEKRQLPSAVPRPSIPSSPDNHP